MPRRLLARCQPDSIREFRLSAQERYEDGLTAATQGRWLSAIYLWGYCAEMTLKAAYFSATGVSNRTPLQMNVHINPAIQLGRWFTIYWLQQGQGHNVRAWAELLLIERMTNPNPLPIYTPQFSQELQRCGHRIGLLWNETLRYHKNRPYRFELAQVQESVEWLLAFSNDL